MREKWRVRRRAKPRVFDHPLRQEDPAPEAQAVVSNAMNGDPGALKKILRSLAAYLVGHAQLPREYALFCSSALGQFADSEPMTKAGKVFFENVATEMAKAVRKDEEAGEVLPGSDLRLLIMLYRGPRLPPAWIRKVGSSFSRAFRLRVKARKSDASSIAEIAESPPCLDHPMSREIATIEAMKQVNSAKKGNPEILRTMLGNLSEHLRGEAEFLREYAFFCADAFKAFADSDEMDESVEVFSQRGELTIEGTTNEWGDRLPGIRTLERAFCRSFHISKPPGMKIPNHPALFPSSAYKVMLLRYFGEPLDHAIEVVCSYYTNESPRRVETWVREMGFDEPIPGPLGGNELAWRRLHLGARVLRHASTGATLQQAFETVARDIAREVLDPLGSDSDERFEDLVPLKTETIEHAYTFAQQCRSDPKWDRLWTYMERRFKRPSNRSD